MPITQAGSVNLTALVVPDLYVVITPPQNLLLNGVPSNIVGVVGTASWGPLNLPTILGSFADYARYFGPNVNRKFDAGTAIAAAVQQGANKFRMVRVSDATDVKAASTGVVTCFTPTALYSGVVGNTLQAALSAGSKPATFRLTVGLPGQTPELFDNIPGTGNAFWLALAAAVNNGQSVSRGPSQLITVVAGVGVTAPAAASFTFTGGTDGASTVTAASLVGVDTAPRTGMYALRGQGCSIGVLADVDDSTQWTTIDGFGLAEGLYMMQVVPAGTTVAAAITAKTSAGLDSYASKLLHGDWIWWNDPVNQLVRLISPQGFAAGRLANLSPEQSSLNKPLYGVVGSQKSGLPTAQNGVYSGADLGVLIQGGIDEIANPAPGGAFWALRCGHNSSSNSGVHGDNYTRMTNYIAASLNAGMGKYLGELITLTLMRRVRSTLMSFCANMLQQGLLGTIDGSLPYSVICDGSNNIPSRTALGYLQADVQIRYSPINEFFIINLEGGQTVTVTRQTLPPLAA